MEAEGVVTNVEAVEMMGQWLALLICLNLGPYSVNESSFIYFWLRQVQKSPMLLLLVSQNSSQAIIIPETFRKTNTPGLWEYRENVVGPWCPPSMWSLQHTALIQVILISMQIKSKVSIDFSIFSRFFSHFFYKHMPQFLLTPSVKW